MTEPFELSERTTERLQQVFVGYPEVREVWLYGYRAKGNAREGSDIDLSLKGSQLTHRHQLQISEAIENLLLPYRVDLSIYDSPERVYTKGRTTVLSAGFLDWKPTSALIVHVNLG